ncbi:MAG: radical SAM family heme chaperone HemW [bacterium]|nr:radical SAM family heme chaperone HemW [bacterium]
MKDHTKDLQTPSRKEFVANYPHFRYWKTNAVEGLLAAPPLNIYVHIPFCMQKCSYCYYKTEELKKKEQLVEYTEALCREIALVGQGFQMKKRPVHSVYIGGGTPSLLSDDMLKRVVAALGEQFTLEGAEMCIEAEPRTVTAKRVKLYQQLGIDRVSIGVQSFNDDVIKQSGRNHSGEKAIKAIETIRDVDENIVVNIDLISGLAGETMETWKKTIDTAITTNVHSITVYKLEVYLNTEFFNKSVRKQLLELPSEKQELEFMRQAIQKFSAQSYDPWCFFTYTRNGKYQHQYASNLWKGEDCCALGSSAFGTLNRYNYQNASELDNYLAMVKDNKIPIIRAYELTGKDLMIRDLLMGMKLCRLDRKAYQQKHGIDICELLKETVTELEAGDYIRVDENHISLATNGILYGDYTAKRLAFALKKYLGLDALSLY